MNTEITEIESNSPDAEAGEFDRQKHKKSGGGRGLAALALLLALVALAGTAWMWWQDRVAAGPDRQQLLTEIARLDAGDSALAMRLDQLRQDLDALEAEGGGDTLEALQQRMQSDRARLAELERVIGEQHELARSLQGTTDMLHARLQAAEAALERVTSSELDAAGNLDLAEVDYLLRLANERLRLFSDVAAADQALALANAHLEALDNPSLLGVRRDIAAARQALSRADLPDTVEIAAELDSLQARIPSLPFAGVTAAAAAPSQLTEESWWARLKGTFAGLVTIRRTADDSTALSLEDTDYVRQRLWLQLEMAHLALMRRDQEGFHASLTRALETLERWFDTTDDELQSVEERVEELASLDIEADLPDITAPWNSLRRLRSAGSPADRMQPSRGDFEMESPPAVESGDAD